MQYTQNGYIVKIYHGSYHTWLVVSDGLKTIYENKYLPVCKNRIETEDNAERIANQIINREG